MLAPSIGLWAMPSIMAGAGIPVASRMVGTMSMMRLNCRRIPPASAMCPGHAIATPCAAPPWCEATCFTHLKGVSVAEAVP